MAEQQIILHPGFHRTGTSSIQHFLWANRKVLYPYVQVLLNRHVESVAHLCTQFSISQNPLDLATMVDALDTAFDAQPATAGRHLIISSETLCGRIPGYATTQDYAAVPTLVAYLTTYLQDRFPSANIRVLFTTRDPEPWLFSVYRHVLRSNRIVEKPDSFARKFNKAAQFDTTMETVAEAISPVETLSLPLEDAAQHPQGPGCVLLDQLSLPSHIFTQVQPVEVAARGASTHMWQEFLAMNKSDLPDQILSAQKNGMARSCLLYTSPSPRDKRQSRMPSSA